MTSMASSISGVGDSDAVVVPYRLWTGRSLRASRAGAAALLFWRAAAHAGLGAEQRDDLEIPPRAEQVDRMAELGVDRGRVDQQAEPPALQQRAALARQPRKPSQDGHRGLSLRENRHGLERDLAGVDHDPEPHRAALVLGPQ